MRIRFVILILLFFRSLLFAQSSNDSLYYNPKKFFAFIYKNDKIITYPKFFKTLKSCGKVVAEHKAVRKDYWLNLGVTFGAIGSSVILLSNEDTKNYYLLPFAFGLAFSIPFDLIHTRPRIKRTVDAYNSKCVQ